jgi:hypothetical protein
MRSDAADPTNLTNTLRFILAFLPEGPQFFNYHRLPGKQIDLRQVTDLSVEPLNPFRFQTKSAAESIQ